MPSNVPIHPGLDEKDRQRLIDSITESYARASAALPQAPGDQEEVQEEEPGPTSEELLEIPEFPELIGIDPSVYRQINAALHSGKQHLMLYGPPGTGKTTLAQRIAGMLHDNWRLITGSADWTSQDIIGGYQPVGGGSIKFIPGVLLQNFDRPLIIDELNRCDIDKVIGPLFTVLSEQPTTLPYRTDVGDVTSPMYTILPKPKPGAAPHEFAPKKGWRIIATLNSIDKAALYQMSFALTRRFGWIYVDVPRDLQGFLIEFLKIRGILGEDVQPPEEMPLTTIWSAVNNVRVIGPAPIIDMVKTIRAIEETVNFLEKPDPGQVHYYLDGFSMYLLPMLDGISRSGAETLANALAAALGLAVEAEESIQLKQRLLFLSV